MNKLVLMGLAAGMAALCAQAQAKTFEFSFAGINDASVFGSGAFKTSDNGSPYTIVNASGSIVAPDVSAGTFTITGLSPYASANQLLYYPTNPLVDFSGISVSTVGGDFNIFYYASAGNYGLIASPLNAGGYIPGVYDPITLKISSIPELSTWVMIGLGFAGLGLAARRTRRTSISAID